MDILARFCGAGLNDGDCCFWVTTPPWTAAIASFELAKYVSSVSEYLTSGQLQFISHEDWYLSGLEPTAILALVTTRIQEAHRQGWSRVRACGKPGRPDTEEGWAHLLRYEQALHQMAMASDLLALCSYRSGSLREQIKSDLLEAHDAVLTRDQEQWYYATTGRRD